MWLSQIERIRQRAGSVQQQRSQSANVIGVTVVWMAL